MLLSQRGACIYTYWIKNEVLASHNAILQSSRFYCLFTLAIETLDQDKGTILKSKLQLVDLAGIEKVSGTGNQGNN